VRPPSAQNPRSVFGSGTNSVTKKAATSIIAEACEPVNSPDKYRGTCNEMPPTGTKIFSLKVHATTHVVCYRSPISTRMKSPLALA